MFWKNISEFSYNNAYKILLFVYISHISKFESLNLMYKNWWTFVLAIVLIFVVAWGILSTLWIKCISNKI